MRKYILPVLLATVWIGFSEFMRNQIIFANLWRKHYELMGQSFPEHPINAVVWMLWSIVFASCIAFLLSKMSRKEAIALAWVMGFVLMWLTIGNLGVLPFIILLAAVPLSLIEVVVAVYIIQKLLKK